MLKKIISYNIYMEHYLAIYPSQAAPLLGLHNSDSTLF